MLSLSYTPYRLRFYKPAGTSRGVLHEKLTYILTLTDTERPGVRGLGEAALFQGLSAEDNDTYEPKLKELCRALGGGASRSPIPEPARLPLLGEEVSSLLTGYSSIRFGLEQAIANLESGKPNIWFPSDFTEGRSAITINGLVWMSDFASMIRQIDRKVALGFRCIKLKIGAIDWEHELQMVRHIRSKYPASELEIRVDANGAFSPADAMHKMDLLARLGVHSIEQPIRAGQPEEMARLCRETALPIALDEELIGHWEVERPAPPKRRSEPPALPAHCSPSQLLDFIQPQYIILKPALCGGFSGAKEWIDLASELGIGWWVTSALESNIGLTALAQWTATLGVQMPQGLGTGALYANNFFSPLRLQGEKLRFNNDR